MKKSILYSSLCAILLSCGSTKLLTPTQADVDRVKSEFPEVTVASLNEGKSIMENNCNRCHKLFHPETKNVEQWNQIVPIMAKKAKLNAADEQKVLRYILTAKSANQ
jgi:hypothetical protein